MTEDSSQRSFQNTSFIWWSSFVYAPLIYGVAGFFCRRSGHILFSAIPAPIPKILVVLTPTLFGVALLEMILLLDFIPRLAGKMNYSSYSILRWALTDSIGIYGLVLFLLGASWKVFGGFLGLAFLLLLLFMPTQNDRDRFESLKHDQG